MKPNLLREWLRPVIRLWNWLARRSWNITTEISTIRDTKLLTYTGIEVTTNSTGNDGSFSLAPGVTVRAEGTGYRGVGLLQRWRTHCSKSGAHTSSPLQPRDPAGEPISPNLLYHFLHHPHHRRNGAVRPSNVPPFSLRLNSGNILELLYYLDIKITVLWSLREIFYVYNAFITLPSLLSFSYIFLTSSWIKSILSESSAFLSFI